MFTGGFITAFAFIVALIMIETISLPAMHVAHQAWRDHDAGVWPYVFHHGFGHTRSHHHLWFHAVYT